MHSNISSKYSCDFIPSKIPPTNEQSLSFSNSSSNQGFLGPISQSPLVAYMCNPEATGALNISSTTSPICTSVFETDVEKFAAPNF
ncbi:MAG: hypothetical protein H6607_02095 [Flavobacteriales bacterium]|nr:hypothetical protein [Flavobacteriales bacterium]